MTSPHSNDNDNPQTADVFVTLLMEYRHRLFAFILKQLINRADAEDVFQKTSVVLWRKMDQFDRNGSFFHWACGIAYNEVRNFLKVQRRSKLHFDDELTTLLAEEARSEEADSESRLNAMRQCISRMTDRQQKILRQCYSSSESITDVADRIGETRTAVYKQLARLRDKLAACIQLRLAQEGGTS